MTNLITFLSTFREDTFYGVSMGLVIIAGVICIYLLLILLYLLNAHLIPLLWVLTARDAIKKAGRYLMAAGASKPVGLSTREIQEIAKKYGGRL